MSERSLIDDELRVRAIDHLREQRWADLLELQPRLERDDEYWTSLWGPACAVAAYHEGRSDARELLVAVIDTGFHDVTTHAALFADTFATEPDWLDLRARMEANKPPPPIELTDWPCATPILPLVLDRLDPAGESALRRRVPAPTGTAQETALEMLTWVASRWRHSGANHVAGRDANEVLDRVEAGERFACREYTILLTQALNAVGIPARPLSLFRADYYTGMGTGHAVTEAWLDDLGRWVVLDGQNGATWRDRSGALLGVVALQKRLLDEDRAVYVGAGSNFDADAGEEWFAYFRHCSSGGAAWRADSFVPLMEGRSVVEARPLLKDAGSAHPDLADIATSIVDHNGPAVLFTTHHPFATGFAMVDEAGESRELAPGEPLPLTGGSGEHAWQVATRTPFGTLRSSRLRFTIRRS